MMAPSSAMNSHDGNHVFQLIIGGSHGGGSLTEMFRVEKLESLRSL